MSNNPSINEFEEIDKKCEGCENIYIRIDKKKVCMRHCFPHTKWWFDECCPDATHIKQDK
jgi:hypothetical protein